MVLLHHYHLYLPIPRSLTDSRFNLEPPSHLYRFSIPHIEPPPCKLASFIKSPLLIPRFKEQVFCRSSSSSHIVNSSDDEFSKRSKTEKTREGTKNNFWGAVSLIIGTAVGPGMLGLPAATIKSGSFPSTIAILLCWVYVISSIILVAELSFSAMHEDGIAEVSFIGLATKALGTRFGALVAVVYASLSFSLLVACVSGIGSIVSLWFPSMNRVLAHALFPTTVGVVIGFFPFRVIDTANRFLCSLMVASITALVGIGLSVTRASVLGSFGHTSWNISLILPAIPVTVLTLGFHVITPFICKIAGDTISKARKAILIGGTVPLIMVLSWNLIVLGLAGSNRAASSSDPISLLLSVNPSALSAVQGFAFSALATSSIGYAVSFPKQLLDTLELISKQNNVDKSISSRSPNFSDIHRTGRVGCVTFSDRSDHSNAGMASFNKFWRSPAAEAKAQSSTLERLWILLEFMQIASCLAYFLQQWHMYRNPGKSSGHQFCQEAMSRFCYSLRSLLFWQFGTRVLNKGLGLYNILLGSLFPGINQYSNYVRFHKENKCAGNPILCGENHYHYSSNLCIILVQFNFQYNINRYAEDVYMTINMKWPATEKKMQLEYPEACTAST